MLSPWYVDRNDLLGQDSLFLCCGGLLLAVAGEQVLIFPTYPEALDQVLGRFAHGFGPVETLHLWVHKAPAKTGVVHPGIRSVGLARLAHDIGRAGHLLHPTGQKEIPFARQDRSARLRHCRHARGTQAVDRFPGDRPRQTSQERSHSSHIAVVFSSLIGTTHQHIIDLLRVESGMPFHQCAEHMRGQIICTDRRQTASKGTHTSTHSIDQKSLLNHCSHFLSVRNTCPRNSATHCC